MFLARTLRRLARRFGYDIVRAGASPDPWTAVAELLRGTPRPVAFDVGANVGQTAERLLARLPGATVYSFEPAPETFAALARNVAHSPAVRPLRAALGDSDSEAVLSLNRDSTTNSLLAVAPRGMAGHVSGYARTGEEVVPLWRLDSFCGRHGVGRIDLLKIDTQGAELKVLEGCGDLLDGARIRLVFAELLFAPFYDGQAWADEILAFLRRRGYRLVDLFSHGRHHADGLALADALFAPARAQ